MGGLTSPICDTVCSCALLGPDNDPGNPWHYPAFPHHQQLNNGSTEVWWNVFFPCLCPQGWKGLSGTLCYPVWDLVGLPLAGASPQVMNKVNAIFPQPLWPCTCCSTQTQLTKDARETKFPELCQKGSHQRGIPGITLEKQAGWGLREELLIVPMKRSAHNIISNQKVEQIWHLSSQVRKEASIQRWSLLI